MEMNEVERKYFNQLVTSCVTSHEYNIRRIGKDGNIENDGKIVVSGGESQENKFMFNLNVISKNGDLENAFLCTLRPQVSIGKYRVDFVIDTEINNINMHFFIEIDSFSWHDRNMDEFESSRMRQDEIVSRGFVPFIIPVSLLNYDSLNVVEGTFTFIVSWFSNIYGNKDRE